MTYKFKITEGCPKTGHKIACNTTQDAPAFSTNQPSAAERAREGMAQHTAQKANEAAYTAAKETEKKQLQVQPKRLISNEEIEG